MTASRKAGGARRLKRPSATERDAGMRRAERLLERGWAGMPLEARRAAMAAGAWELKHLHD
jgi:hypothetical protein